MSTPSTVGLPAVSIIMPVYNTGAYLRDAVDSVLGQQPIGATQVPSFELIIVDDHSTDALTLSLLEDLGAEPRVRILRNTRSKGAAGARNTGIVHARGAWIGFLDADDLWFPDALAIRWRALCANPGIDWLGAKFQLLKPAACGAPFPTSATLCAALAERALPPEPTRMIRPVAAFSEDCLIGIMTVLIRRELIEEKQMFNEQLLRAEDYQLWFQCALDNDLWMLPIALAHYRIHAASLTHGDAPRFLHEDTMLAQLLAAPAWRGHLPLLERRMDMVIQDHCYFYRGRQRYASALRWALRWVVRRPFKLAAWKELAASCLRAG